MMPAIAAYSIGRTFFSQVIRAKQASFLPQLRNGPVYLCCISIRPLWFFWGGMLDAVDGTHLTDEEMRVMHPDEYSDVLENTLLLA